MNKVKGLCVLDVDGTLIEEEVIDLLGKEVGCEKEVAQITSQAMRGELDFESSLKKRVSLLKGISTDVFDKIGLVSGGFTIIVEKLAKEFGIPLFVANQLEISDGHLTGNLIGPVISREVKEETLVSWAKELEVPFERTIAIGDGANDLKMLKIAGLGIAFCARDIVKKEINLQVDERDFGKVLEMIDFL